MQEVGDRVPLIEGNVSLPPGDLGVVISAAVSKLCPKFRSLLGQYGITPGRPYLDQRGPTPATSAYNGQADR